RPRPARGRVGDAPGVAHGVGARETHPREGRPPARSGATQGCDTSGRRGSLKHATGCWVAGDRWSAVGCGAHGACLWLAVLLPSGAAGRTGVLTTGMTRSGFGGLLSTLRRVHAAFTEANELAPWADGQRAEVR